MREDSCNITERRSVFEIKTFYRFLRNKIWAKSIIRHFIERKYVQKPTETCSDLLVLRERQIRTAFSYPMELAKLEFSATGNYNYLL